VKDRNKILQSGSYSQRPDREADHLPKSSAEVKNEWSYTSTHTYVSMVWRLVKHRDNFTFS